MRTTLTLDDDIAVQLTRLREERKVGLRAAVNEAMRAGLKQMLNPARSKRKACRTPVFHATRTLIGDMTNVSDMLAVAEGDDYR
jgi:hypothetical protein